MKSLISGEIDLNIDKKDCVENWNSVCRPDKIAMQQIAIYEELLQ